jgi:hypothetical protein
MKPNTDFKSLPLEARCTIVLFCVAGLAAALYSVAFQPLLASSRIFLLLAFAAGTARMKVNLFKGSTLSFLTCVILLTVIQEGPAVAVFVALWGVTVQTVLPSRKIVLHQLAFNAGMIAITVTASWLAYHALAGSHGLATFSAEVTATVVASFTYFLGNSVSVALIVALTQGMSVFQIWFHHFLFSAPSFLIAGLVSLGSLAAIGASSRLIATALLSPIVLAYCCSVWSNRFMERAA